MSTSGALFILDTMLAALPGVSTYVQSMQLLEVETTTAERCLLFYEVRRFVDVGSWWVPCALEREAPDFWRAPRLGGIEPLRSSGDAIWTEVAGEPLVRPARLYWWLSAATLTNVVTPASVRGNVLGSAPTEPPPDVPREALALSIGRAHGRTRLSITTAALTLDVRGRSVVTRFSSPEPTQRPITRGS